VFERDGLHLRPEGAKLLAQHIGRGLLSVPNARLRLDRKAGRRERRQLQSLPPDDLRHKLAAKK
jgi:hypothetical protein